MKETLTAVGLFIVILLLIVFTTGFNLKIEGWVKPQEAKIDRETTEQSKSFVLSQNEQAAAFLVEAVKATDPNQKKALLGAACGILNGMAQSTVSSSNHSIVASMGGCQ